MNKIQTLAMTAAAAATAFFSACQSDTLAEGGQGEGRVNFNIAVNSDVVVTRAADAELTENCKIYVYNSDGLIRKYDALGDLPGDGLALVTGDYTVKATAGDSLTASFKEKYYKGSAPFTVKRGESSTVDVVCKIANVLTTVKFDPTVDEVLTDYKVTIKSDFDSLAFTKQHADSIGYFMMTSKSDKLTYILTGKKKNDGSTYTTQGTIETPLAAHQYDLTVKYSEIQQILGGAFITIKVDESAVEVNDTHVLTMPPAVFGKGFDITKEYTAEPGLFQEDMTVYVAAATKMTACEVDGSLLAKLGLSRCDVVAMTDDERTAADQKGFGAKYKYSESEDNAVATLTLGAAALNQLPVGDYELNITATDAKGKSTQKKLTLAVTNALVLTDEASVAKVNTYSATVTGTVVKTENTGFGIKYRKQGETAWTDANATVSGTVITADLSGLAANTAYEYRAYCDGFEGQTKTFTTLNDLQVSEAGMENWYTASDNALCIGSSADNMFWDTGNHGSITLNKNVTTNESSIKHGGQYSAKLKSQFVGIGAIGKFAAGNMFVGKYLGTDGTDGILGFGRPFKARPYALKLYVKYTPGTIDYVGSGAPSECQKGQNDKGIVYIAMFDGTTTAYSGTSWPCVIKTKSKQFFSKDDANVLGYGEASWRQATEGDGLIEVTIPITYSNMNVVPSSMVICCTASAWGDYFSGSTNSVMYVDDFELLYK